MTTLFKSKKRNSKIKKESNKKIWDLIKNITIIISLSINLFILLFFATAIIKNVSINFSHVCYATTTEDVTMCVPATFYMEHGSKISGDTYVTLPKGLLLPVKINMNIPVKIIPQKGSVQPISIKVK